MKRDAVALHGVFSTSELVFLRSILRDLDLDKFYSGEQQIASDLLELIGEACTTCPRGMTS